MAGGVTSPGPGGKHLTSGPRSRTLPRALGCSALTALMPGCSFLVAGHRRLAAAVFTIYVLLVAAAAYAVIARHDALLRLVVQPQWLTVLIVVSIVMCIAWLSIVLAGEWMLRPPALSTVQRVLEAVAMAVICCAVVAPFALVVNYSAAQRSFVKAVFPSYASSHSATRPTDVSEKDPWGGRGQVSILLLGGDAGPEREGNRTDSVMVATINTSTGRTVLFGLPRNLEKVPFAARSPLAKLYPDGFTGPGDPLEYMLNAIYRNVPAAHPGVLGKSDNEGADALKLAASGALGIRVDYYALINLAGFVELVDAIGGVTVDVNEPIPIGGITGEKEPEGYIQPGPHQKLDGFHALWFARGRYGLDDYDRMRRQRCLMDDIIHEADVMTMLTRYKKILAAGRNIIQTDIPGELLPAFVDLAGLVKQAKVRSVVFARSVDFAPDAPDYGYMRRVVQQALSRKPAAGHRHSADSPVERPEDTCGYQPTS
ncbi:MAG: LCP family protein [Nocardioidaceae bacterium]